MPKVSIIMPIYNVEKFLPESLESVCRQTLKDIEIICVNDGSTDGSLEILEKAAEKDKRIIIVDKVNAGYGAAMNSGFYRASGEYLGIVEPDDHVPLNMYEDLYRKAREYDLDFIKSDFYRFETDEKKNVDMEYVHLSKNKEDYNHVFCPLEYLESFRFSMNTWTGIYRMDFLKEYHILHNETPGAAFQDCGFWFQTFCHGRRAMIVDTPYYRYRWDNPNSSVNNPKKVYNINEEYEHIKNVVSGDPEIWDRVKYWYTYRKFHSYLFTLTRISKEYRHAYILDICEEFREAERQGEVDRSIFTPGSLVKFNLLVKDPEEFYMDRYYKGLKKDNKKEKEQYENKIKALENSAAYRIGRAVTWIPRKCRSIFKKS